MTNKAFSKTPTIAFSESRLREGVEREKEDYPGKVCRREKKGLIRLMAL